jgi:hypothetical protein
VLYPGSGTISPLQTTPIVPLQGGMRDGSESVALLDDNGALVSVTTREYQAYTFRSFFVMVPDTPLNEGARYTTRFQSTTIGTVEGHVNR